MFSSFRSVKMVSFWKICCTIILFSTFLLNVESKQSPYPGGNSNTVNMTCEDGYDNLALFKKYYSEELVDVLNGRHAALMNCNFTFSNVEFQADFFVTNNLTLSELKVELANAYQSIKQLKTEISALSAQIMESISRLGDKYESAVNKIRNEYLKILKKLAKVEPFALSDFPKLEVIMANITLAPSALKVEPKSVNMTCNIAPFDKKWDYINKAEYTKFFFTNIKVLECNFTIGHANYQSDMFLLDRASENKMSISTFYESVHSIFEKSLDLQRRPATPLKTDLSPDSFGYLTVFPMLYLRENDNSSKESYKKFMLNQTNVGPFLLSDYPQFELKMTNITKVTPVDANAEMWTVKKEVSFFPVVFDFFLLKFFMPLLFIRIVDNYVVKPFCST